MTNTENIPIELRERFRMNDERYVLELCVRHGAYRSRASQVLTCAMYATVAPARDDSQAPKIRTSIFVADYDGQSENVQLVKTHTGVSLRFGHNEIDNIHRDERDRLHALLLQLRGVEYQYTADLFGFLKKDGSDIPQKFDLQFPATQN